MPKSAPKSSLEHQAPQATQRIQGTIRVRAIRRGFYDNHVKEAGAVFTVRSDAEIGKWMERVSDEAVADEPSGASETVDGAEASEPTKKSGKKAKGSKDEPSGASENDVL